jgi:hypothetical protein
MTDSKTFCQGLLPFLFFSHQVYYSREGENKKKSYWFLSYNERIEYIIAFIPRNRNPPQKIITHLFLYCGRSFVMSVAETGGCQGKHAIISYHISQSVTSV